MIKRVEAERERPLRYVGVQSAPAEVPRPELLGDAGEPLAEDGLLGDRVDDPARLGVPVEHGSRALNVFDPVHAEIVDRDAHAIDAVAQLVAGDGVEAPDGVATVGGGGPAVLHADEIFHQLHRIGGNEIVDELGVVDRDGLRDVFDRPVDAVAGNGVGRKVAFVAARADFKRRELDGIGG